MKTRNGGIFLNIKWNAEEYGKGFSFVHRYGEEVLELFSLKEGSFVCDLGCGRGNLSGKLEDKGYRVIGVDASEEMLEAAKASFPNIEFVLGNALDFKLPQKADGIFSNAVFHWIDAGKQEAMLENIAKNLRVGGELVCEFGGKGCAESVHSCLKDIFESRELNYIKEFYFPTIGEYAPLLEKAGLKPIYAVLFDRPTPQKEGLRGWIRMFDKKPFENLTEKETDEIIKEAEARLRPALFTDQGWIVDYVRIRLKAIKI